MDVVYLEEVEPVAESIDIDTPLEIRHQPRFEIRHLTLEAKKNLESRYRPIVRKSRVSPPKPIKLNKPIQDTVFASLDDYLAAIKTSRK